MIRALQVFVVLLVLAVLGVAAVVMLSYRSGLEMMPADRAPNAQAFPEPIQRQFALASGYGWPPDFPRLRPSEPLEHAVGVVMGRVPEAPFGERGLARDAARLIIRQRPGNGRNNHRYGWQIETAGRIWISRHWSAGQALDTMLAESHYGDNQVGLVDAARHYFNLEPGQLGDGELAVLLIARSDPSFYSPWCHADRITDAAKQKGLAAPRFDRLVAARAARCR